MDLRIQNTEETPTNVCLFDTLDPNTGGTVFDPADLEADTDTVFVSESDASTWVYNGSAYITKTFEIPDNTPFWLYGTSLDAGGNKTAMIQRNGPIFVNSSTSNGSRYAGYFYSRATSGQGNGMLIRKDSRTTSGNYLLIEGRNFSTGVNEEKFKVGHNGDLTINDAYTLPTTDGAVGEVLQTDGTGNIAWAAASGGGSGILGISDSSGAYTYYSDFASAISAASSGDTIEMFADIEETTNTTVTLIDGITINGNGHTYTLNVDDTADAFTFTVASGTVYLNNIKVVRTGRTAGTTSGATFNHVSNTIKCQGAVFINDYGRGFRGDAGSIHNAHIISYLEGIYAPFSSKNIHDCYIKITGTAQGTYISGGFMYGTTVEASANAIYMAAGQIYNSVGIATTGYGIVSNGEIYNCVGKSTSNYGISGQRVTNCVAISSTNYATNASTSRNCTFISVSGRGAFRGSHQNATIISSSNIGINEPVELDNCYVESSTNIPVNFRDNSEVRNSSIYSKWNNTGGHGTTSFTVRTNPIVTNTSIKVANASAYCLNMYPGSTLRYANNSFQGSTTPVNTTNLTQGITNTSDSQGNILI